MSPGEPPIVDLEAPIKRRSVAEQVAHRILELVRTGSLGPGDQLPPERELAASLQVSRPSVREAIRGLTILGVVRTRQGGGLYITDLGAEELLGPLQFFISLEDVNLRELYDARMLIESDVARRAARTIMPAQLTRLQEILAAQEDTLDDPVRFRLSDTEFHEILWDSADNAFLRRIGKSLNVLGLESRKMASETPGVLRQSFADHKAIVAALSAGDAAQAAICAARHMRNVYETTISKNEQEREDNP